MVREKKSKFSRAVSLGSGRLVVEPEKSVRTAEHVKGKKVPIKDDAVTVSVGRDGRVRVDGEKLMRSDGFRALVRNLIATRAGN